MTEHFRNDNPFTVVIPRFGLKVIAGAEFDLPDEDLDTLENQPGFVELSGNGIRAYLQGALVVLTGSGTSSHAALAGLDGPAATATGALIAIAI